MGVTGFHYMCFARMRAVSKTWRERRFIVFSIVCLNADTMGNEKYIEKFKLFRFMEGY